MAEEEQEEAEEEEGVEEEAKEAQEEEKEAEEEEEADEGEEGEDEEGHEVAEEGENGEEKEDEEGEEEAEEEAEEQATARQVRVTLAKDRTYIQQKDSGGAWTLIVEVSEEERDNHRDFIRAIFSAMMQDMGFGKEEALRMRNEFLLWR